MDALLKKKWSFGHNGLSVSCKGGTIRCSLGDFELEGDDSQHINATGKVHVTWVACECCCAEATFEMCMESCGNSQRVRGAASARC